MRVRAPSRILGGAATAAPRCPIRPNTILALALLLPACQQVEIAKVTEPPVVSIQTPADGAVFDEGVTITMQGKVIDDAYSDALDSLAVTWAVDGARACEGAVFDAGGITTCDNVFAAGDAVVTLTATDLEGQSATATSNVTVNPNGAPTATIVAPESSGTFYADHPIVFEGLATDGEDSPDQLTVEFSDSVDGILDIDSTPTSGGDVSGSVSLSQGSHFITMTVTDTTGRTGEDTVALDVNGPNTVPTCGITAPTNNFAASTGDPILFEGTATDPDIPANTLDVNWYSDKDGLIGASTPNSSGDFFLSTSTLSTNVHTITLEVMDDVGALCTDAILVQVGNAPLVVLSSPGTGGVYNEGDPVTFTANVSDAEDAPTQITFSWDSDVDGVFSTQGANSSGLSTFTYSRLSRGTHTITVNTTDTDGFTSLDRSTIQINGLPTAPGVVLTPSPATSADNLVATVTTPATDPDGDALTYQYAWYQNGLLTAYTGNTIDTSATARGENWEVRVSASDGHGTGPTGSAVTTIQNGLPTAAVVSISPGTADTTDTLTATVTGWSDADGDPEGYYYQWARNGTDISGATDSSLSPSLTTRGDVITVTATPWDGRDRGTPITSGSRTISNSAPTTPTIAITPELPEDEDSFTCAVTGPSTDADGDSVSYSYAWTRNGSPTGIVSQTVDPTYTSNGDTWICSVTATDGTDSAAAATDSVTVGDHTPPDAPTLGSIGAYRNEDYAVLTGTAEANSDITIYIQSSSGTTTQTTTANSGGNFTLTVTSLTRALTYSFYAIATDASGNSSVASNTVGTEACDPYDDYDLSTTSGDTCSDSIVDWAVLPDDGHTVLDVVGNILDAGDSDWYLVQSTDALTTGINYYRFHVRMTHGSGSYVFIVHDGGCEDAYVSCSTAGYTEYEAYAYDSNDSGHGTPGDTRYCSYGSSSLYNTCDDLSSDYYIEVRRTSSRYSCEYYELEISNGIW